MKKLLNLLVMILIVSCTKDVSKPTQQSFGVLESFLSDNPDIIVQKTTESNVAYRDGFATNRGYHFKTLSDIKITEIGGKIARTGTYKIRISHIEALWSWTDILIDSIIITNTSRFQYKHLSEEILLPANQDYLIRYYNPDHSSVYDAGLGYAYSNSITLPLLIDDIEIKEVYYSYEGLVFGEYVVVEQGLTNSLEGILRGLVDFKYEPME